MRVVSYDPRHRILVMSAAVAVGLAMIVGGFFLGRSNAASRVDQLSVALAEEETEVASLNEVRTKLADFELSRTLEEGANQELRQTIKSLHGEVADLKEEVSFYKNLMAPSSLKKGLAVDRFELSQSSDRSYDYYMLLTQIVDRRTWVQGSVQVDVLGTGENNEQQVLPLTEIASLESYPLKYRFRYFQDYSGKIKLPVGFKPLSIVITVDRNGKKEDIQKRFNWKVSGV